MPTFGSLFAGIGGIDLGLERAGWTGRWQVEWDAYCQRVLAKHWPDIPRYGDITTVDWSGVEPVDLLAGGFPCQPFSVAGRRKGIEDDRWLWPEFARAVRHLRPSHVLIENVPGLLGNGGEFDYLMPSSEGGWSMGDATNDVGGGMGAVLGDLAELGYDAQWDSIPAAAVGAPHLRYRVWIVAYRAELGRAVADADLWGSFDPLRAGRDAARNGGSDAVADANEFDAQGIVAGITDAQVWSRSLERPTGSRRDGERWWRTEPDVGRVAHGVPSRVDRLRSLGNAVVPQVVEVIGRRLLALIESEKMA